MSAESHQLTALNVSLIAPTFRLMLRTGATKQRVPNSPSNFSENEVDQS
jgi:hypothetical protein